ncbi:MAG: hypothetical protein FH756_06115 [Firmicutes bacterium]|nr:hypothetical protein [Bacillota bacterium]
MAKIDEVVSAIKEAQAKTDELLYSLKTQITPSGRVYIEVVSERDLEQVPGEVEVKDVPGQPWLSYLEKEYNGVTFRYAKWDLNFNSESA